MEKNKIEKLMPLDIQKCYFKMEIFFYMIEKTSELSKMMSAKIIMTIMTVPTTQKTIPNNTDNLPRGNCNHRLENSCLQTRRFKMGHFKMPHFPYVLNFRGWIKLIYDKITLIYSVKMSLIKPLKFRT